MTDRAQTQHQEQCQLSGKKIYTSLKIYIFFKLEISGTFEIKQLSV